MIKKDMTHISLHMDAALAKAARIQAINDGVSLKAWISQAIIRQLGSESRPAGQGEADIAAWGETFERGAVREDGGGRV